MTPSCLFTWLWVDSFRAPRTLWSVWGPLIGKCRGPLKNKWVLDQTWELPIILNEQVSVASLGQSDTRRTITGIMCEGGWMWSSFSKSHLLILLIICWPDLCLWLALAKRSLWFSQYLVPSLAAHATVSWLAALLMLLLGLLFLIFSKRWKRMYVCCLKVV